MLYFFEHYTFDTDRRELLLGAVVVPTTPQVFDLLDYLIRHRERVVSKDDLINAIWKGRAVSDAALTTRLNVARSAIGDSGGEQRLIKTLPRKGFRFVGQVQEAPGRKGAAVPDGTIEPKRLALALPDKPSIAVLPFENLSGDPEQEYFADGMVEEIVTALSRNKQLFVIARNSSFAFKGRPVEITQVARDLGVRYVLEGSVRKSGRRVRIAGQLIDAASGSHLWADRYDGALEDIFDLQDQVAASVAGAIAPSVSQAEMERAKRKPTSNLDAYDYYLRGDASHFEFTRDATNRAVGLYERAIALDPQFALAHAALAVTLSSRKAFGWSTDPASDRSQAITYAKTALRLESQDASVLARSALVLTFNSNEVELADSLLNEAIRLDPNGMSGWMWGGWTKTILGDPRTALDYLQRALRLSPLDPRIAFANEGLAFAHFFLGNYKEGLKFAANMLRHHPTYVQGLRMAMACHAMLGDMEAAQKLWQQVALLSPSDRLSGIRKRSPWRDQDFAKLEEAYRLAGMPE
ncbi:winged helix-turn-helix domain-containing protein [Bradyrhizobium liaoningense]|uniref:winged helix-turn-helix domain-containing tetratricopeptide repeat protein n=1 Tax=Bradyrhizobium liaoningense TaxID=43992 RepID=UPI001BA7D63A|nr:winged helix-turn-helix domain-containing protein [Bradyrhizobium liaoningense]MBR0715031.1 winged helix-turn-helix domain-containing protein [Bradyrhizobium liaoningense]